MELSYRSVTQFYADLKKHLLDAGLTVARTVVPDTDIVFDTGSGFFRLRRVVVSPTVMAIGWEFGADADVLAVAEWDAEFQMPFAVSPGAEFAPLFGWEAEQKRMFFCVMSGGDVETRGSRYRIGIDLPMRDSSVMHEDRFRLHLEPNFKAKGGSYIPAGA
jgi:hypothetical protein